MAGNYTKLGALLCGLVLTMGLAGSAAAAHKTHHHNARQHKTVPGVTKHQIKIGGTFPLTGPASLYKTIPAAEEAYYAYVNAHGGVNGRKIKDIVLDDQYNPALTVPETQKLVEQDHVFADVGSLGTPTTLSVWSYLNEHKVPEVLVATGDGYWGNCVHRACGYGTVKKSWTMGWEPDYPAEGRLYAKYILAHQPNAKIGVLYQNDAYGKNYLGALRHGLGSSASEIVATQPYNVTDSAQVVGGHVVALTKAGVNTFVIFATPGAAIAALATEAQVPGWTPMTIVNNVSADRTFILLAAQNGATPNGLISTNYLASPTTQPNLKGMTLAKKIIHQYAPSLDQSFAEGDANIIFGLGSAWTFVYALKHAGKNPTRASLMHALRHMNTKKNPFVYPGIKIQTSSKRHFPMEQLIFIKWSGGATGDWQPFGKVLHSGH